MVFSMRTSKNRSSYWQLGHMPELVMQVFNISEAAKSRGENSHQFVQKSTSKHTLKSSTFRICNKAVVVDETPQRAIYTLFNSVHTANECVLISLPSPLPFQPPNGISMAIIGLVAFTPTLPASNRFATRRARDMSRV